MEVSLTHLLLHRFKLDKADDLGGDLKVTTNNETRVVRNFFCCSLATDFIFFKHFTLFNNFHFAPKKIEKLAVVEPVAERTGIDCLR